MSDKSYVTLEQRVCHVCGKQYDTGSLLIDKRLCKKFEHHTVTGWGLCEEHQKLFDDGFIALVEATAPAGAKMLKQEDANRTGNIAHLRRPAFNRVFNTEAPVSLPMVFVEPGVIEELQEMTEKGGKNENT